MLLSYLVSSEEMMLLGAIRELGYGYMYGVRVEEHKPDLPLEVTHAEKDFLEAIRNGLQEIDVLTVHGGEPTVAETDYKHNGFRCRKKIRFPTVKTEG